MRLIDADTLLHYMRSTLSDLTEESGAYETAWIDAMNEIKFAPTIEPKNWQNGWIGVGERLPENNRLVLVCNDDGHMMVAQYIEETVQ